jgi:hypothetical protein
VIELAMPALGSDMDGGTLDEWLVAPGDTVTRGQVVAVVETTKAAVEIERWHDGIVRELLVPVGETVGVAISIRSGGLVAPALHDVPEKGLDHLMHALPTSSRGPGRDRCAVRRCRIHPSP